MAAKKVVPPFAIGQKIWNAWAAWTVRNSGFQKLGMGYMEV